MQAKVGLRAALLIGVFLVTVVVIRGGSALADRSDAANAGPRVVNEQESEPAMPHSPRLTIVSDQGLRHLREAEAAGASMADALAAASSDGPEATPYPHSAHYLAFITAYLRDEAGLPDRDWDLGDAFFKERKRITDVMPRAGVDLAVFHVDGYDELELRREFHAGGPLNDPEAGQALKDALHVLQKNFEGIDADGALVISY